MPDKQWFVIQHRLTTPFSIPEKTFIFFVAKLLKDGLASTTIKAYLAAIRYSQIALGLGNLNLPNMYQLEYVLQAARKLARSKSSSRLPTTLAFLSEQFNASMLWAASCMCYFGFLRSGEVVAPSNSSFVGETVMAMLL